jgi:hypothetical protein
MNQTFHIRYNDLTIYVPTDVRAAWLCSRFSLPKDFVLGVVLPDGLEIDLTVDDNATSRSFLPEQHTTLLLQPKPRPPPNPKQREADMIQRFLETGYWPMSNFIHMVLNRFNLPLDLRKIIARYAAPMLKEEEWDEHNINQGYQNQAPTAPTVFKLETPAILSEVSTYHFWLTVPVASLDPPATIGLLHVDTEFLYGPWSVFTTEDGVVAGYGGSVDYHWHAVPPEPTILPRGTYHVIDSHNPSWSMNSSSGNAGYFHIGGTKYTIENPELWEY